MSDDSDTVSDAFAALGDETRVDVLRALVDARREDPEDPELSFSELQARVGAEDSGGFNYHLGKLRGRYVEETDGAYALTYAGREVAGAILAGTVDPALELGPERIDDPCPICVEPLVATYEHGELVVECDNDHTPMMKTVPPAAADDRSLRELLMLTAREAYADLAFIATGVCHQCYGHVDRRIESLDDEDSFVDHVYRTRCERCGTTTDSTASVVVVPEPAFVSFCHRHGVDIAERPPWGIPGLVEGETTQVASDPARYRVRMVMDADAFEAIVDASGNVLNTDGDRQ